MTNLEAIKILDNLKAGDYSNPYEKGEAIVMAISALQAQEAKTQLSEEGTTFDLISRQAAIDVCDNAIDLWHGQLGEGIVIAVKKKIEELPSAQPEIEERTEEFAQNVPKEDLISRKAVIDSLWEIRQKEISDGRRFHDYCSLSTAVDVIKDLPSAQPEPLVKESRTLVKDLVKDTISRQAAIDALVKAIRKDPYYDSNEAINGLGVCDVRVILNDLPSAQPEIVRCKDCKYCDRGIDEDGNPFLKCLGWVYGGTQEEDFCSHAERRTE